MIETMPEVRPIETVTPIKPSEAIRLGCLVRPRQAYKSYYGRESSCALGAMADGFGLRVDVLDHPGNVGFMVRDLRSDSCPVVDCEMVSFDPTKNLLPHLNDDHRWSRERIADWLESIGL